jgi:hypothetical protein
MEAPVREIIVAAAITAGSFLAVWFAGWFLTVFNSVVGLRNRVKQAWANVDVELKRRADLVPNLVSMVRAYAKHEAETQESAAELRTRQETSGNVLRGCAPVAKMLAERYPDLKANGNFLSLQKSLVETEQRIALSRTYYNDIATFYNTRLQVIPDSLVAGIGMMKPATLYGAQDLERADVKVNLAE